MKSDISKSGYKNRKRLDSNSMLLDDVLAKLVARGYM